MSGKRFFLYLAMLLLLGGIIQIWLASRAGIHGDQYVFLDMALDYHETKELRPVSKSMSGGGSIPGGLLQLLVGVPLSFWYDYRAPAVFMIVTHLAAGLMAALALRRAAGESSALLFTALWWFSPWRLYHSAFLWEPNFLFLPAALHLWACWHLRERKGALASTVLAAVLVLTFQLHGSFLLLAALTAVLLMRRAVRVQWEGALLGTVIGSLPLVPTAAALWSGTMASPAPSASFPGFGIVNVVPVLRGIAYWFRLASLDMGRRIRGLVFFDGEWISSHAGGMVLEWTGYLFVAVAAASTLFAVAAGWQWMRGKVPVGGEGGAWLKTYVSSAFVSLVIVCALSPVTIQGWHVLLILPAACLPVTFWMMHAWPRAGRGLRAALVLFVLLRIPEIIMLGLGHPTYRLDSDIASKLQQRQQTLLPQEYR